MKKFAASMLSAALFFGLAFPITTASAEEASIEKYTVEFTSDVVYAPALRIENARYTAVLYATEDVSGEPLVTDFHSEGYVFNSCGDYTVVYTVEDFSLQSTYEKTINLHIQDTTVPTITLLDVFVEYAEIGEKIEIPTATATDLSNGNIDVNVQVFLNNTELTLNDTYFIPQEEGTYSFVYSAKDSYGNEERLTYSVTAVKAITNSPDSNADKNKENPSCSGRISGVGLIGLPLLVGGIFVFRRKKK